MQCKEPSPGLIYSFGNKISRVGIFKFFFIFKREMPLRIRHGTAIKPNVDQVGLAEHSIAFCRNQDHVIHIGLMHIRQLEACRHKSCLDRFGNFSFDLSNRANTLFLCTIFFAPDRQRGSPVTRTRQVPIHQILEPVAKAARSGRLRFPVDGLVQLNQLIFYGCGFDEPTV